MEIQQNLVRTNDGGNWLNKGDDQKVSRFRGLNVISPFYYAEKGERRNELWKKKIK